MLVLMDIIFLSIIAALLGATLGSFACAQVWRLRANQLRADKATGEEVDEAEYRRLKPLLKGTLRTDRSRCLSCGHTLAWFDLLPIVSWLAVRGKCRYCKKPIGWTEFLAEVGVGALFGLSVFFWPESLGEPLEVVKLAMWLVALVALTINFIYDMRWSLLVSWLNWLLIACGVLFAGISVAQSPDLWAALGSTFGAVMILGGLYALLWIVSRGRWVGDGDMYLGAGIALFLGDWRVAFVALFLANFVGTLVVLPGMMRGTLGRGAHIPFGPLLIVGGLLAWFFGKAIIFGYTSFMLMV